MGYEVGDRRIRMDINNLIDWSVRSKINDEIVVSNLKENNIDNLVDSLVDKFKS